MITEAEALDHGTEVVRLCVLRFFSTNERMYKAAGWDFEDLISYVTSEILVRRFLRSARDTPEYYPAIANYRSSLYRSCWRCCLAHARQFRAEKRRDAYRPGALVHIDQEGPDGELPQFETLVLGPEREDRSQVKRMADLILSTLGCQHARAFLFLLAGKPRATFRRLSQVDEDGLDDLLLDIRSLFV